MNRGLRLIPPQKSCDCARVFRVRVVPEKGFPSPCRNWVSPAPSARNQPGVAFQKCAGKSPGSASAVLLAAPGRAPLRVVVADMGAAIGGRRSAANVIPQLRVHARPRRPVWLKRALGGAAFSSPSRDDKWRREGEQGTQQALNT